ncbi:hypothetical protein B0H14DRAFT_3036175 [Mycena olivaceomarginata]|nr:hypothetical protein B0H14DRAFT_3036175 [Mycena olivaceomarginata]
MRKHSDEPSSNTSSPVRRSQRPKAAVHAPCRVAWRAVGTAPPNVTRVLTPTMSETSATSVCFGTAQDGVVLSNAKLELRTTKATLHLDATNFARGAAGVENQLSIAIGQPHWIFALVSIHGLRITLLCLSFRELLWVAAVNADLTAVVAKWRGCEQGWEREESTRTWWGRGRGRGRRAGTYSRRGAGVHPLASLTSMPRRRHRTRVSD